MRIAIVHYNPAEPGVAGGAESAIRDQRQALEALGHEVYTVFAHPREQYARIQPDIVHFHTIHVELGLDVLEWAQARGIPHVLSLHDYWPFCTGRMLLKSGDQSCAAVAGMCDGDCAHKPAAPDVRELVNGSATVTFNEYTAAILERHGVRITEVIPHGIDTDYFAPPRERAAGCNVVTVSAWPQYPTKGMHILNAALRKIRVKGHLVTGKPRGKVREELREAHILVFPSCYEETWGLCVLPGQHIYTDEGPVPIEDIAVGDRVLTHSGQYKPVSRAPMKRRVDEEIVGLRPVGMNQPIRLTGEHPVYAIPAEGRGLRAIRAWLKDGARPQWIQARDIKKGDLLVMPRGAWADERSSMDVSPHTDIDQVGDVLVSRFSDSMDPRAVTYREVADESGYSYTTVSAVLGHYARAVMPETQAGIEAVAERLGWQQNKLSIPAEWPLDADTGWLLGYYAAEGSISPTNRIDWDCHAREEAYRARVARITQAWGLRPRATMLSGQRARVSVCSTALADVLRALCGCGAENKRFPMDYALANREFAKGLVAGAWAGDGCVANDRRAWSYCTISPQLAQDMRQLLAALGVMASLYEKSYDNGAAKYSIEVSGKQREALATILGESYERQTKRAGQCFITDRQFFYVPVREVTRERYAGPVYNIEVTDDHSYCVEGMGVHNCLTEGMSTGLACIASDVSGPRAQIRDGDTGLLFKNRDADALAEKIQWLIDNPAERERMGDAARAWAVEQASLERMARDYERLYERVIAEQ